MFKSNDIVYKSGDIVRMCVKVLQGDGAFIAKSWVDHVLTITVSRAF
jgi:hypothetical protein